jgi:hypothetical protein
MDTLASVQLTVPSNSTAQVPTRVARYRPASKIDDAVRRRAYASVAKALES